MSIEVTVPTTEGQTSQAARRLSSSSELTSVSESEVKPGKKRSTETGDDKAAKRAKLEGGGPAKEKGIYCHQCHRRCSESDYLRCTRLRAFKKDAAAKKPCNIAWCFGDLKRRYGIDTEQIKAKGPPSGGEHSGPYEFTCPCCTDECQCAQCRKKKGLEPLGAATAKINQQGTPANGVPNGTNISKQTPTKLVQTTITGLTPATASKTGTLPNGSAKSKAKKDSSTFPTDSDSELSDAPAPVSAKPKPKARKSEGGLSVVSKKIAKKDSAASDGKKAGRPKKEGKEKESKDGKKASKKADGKAVNGKAEKGKGKGKQDGAATGTKAADKPKAAPKKPAPKPVEPPIFEKIDTRLSQVEAEERMGLREFLVRFRAVLSIPERNLPLLDDFDRPLSEASVRLFAGALLDTIKVELEDDADDDDEDLINDIFNFREELRYYADLVRFAAIFNALKGPLRFRLPRAAVGPTRENNESQVRALLDLDPNEPTPAWAMDAGPSRRAASKVPQPAEVVRMLLAMTDRAALTPVVRDEMESTAGESEARRVHAAATKKANSEWDAKKKKLGEERVVCKTATETKNDKTKFNEAQKEHDLQIAHANVSLRAAGHVLRHEPLGTDLDGRVYYLLHPRAVESDSRAPIGWASGLLVYGAVPAKAEEDDLPISVARWTHFGDSDGVKQLAKWLDWRIDNLTPKSASKLAAAPRKSILEVVIPQKRQSRKSDDESDSDSDLSSVPDEDLLELLNPVGYVASREKVVEDGKELVKRIKEAAEWLEVVAWKLA